MPTEIRKTPPRWLTPLNWITITILVSSLLVFTLALLAFLHNEISFDDAIAENVRSWRGNSFTSFMTYISYLGNTEFLVPANILLLIFFIIRKDKWTAWRSAIIAVSSLLLMTSLKAIFQRARPDEILIAAISSFSFPSGHGFMTVSFYGFIICWSLVGIKDRRKKILVVIAMLLLIATIGLSRIYLGAHYATDVLAAWGLGTAWLLLSLLIIDKMIAVREKKT